MTSEQVREAMREMEHALEMDGHESAGSNAGDALEEYAQLLEKQEALTGALQTALGALHAMRTGEYPTRLSPAALDEKILILRELLP